jgi:predicted nucleotidyltransferase
VNFRLALETLARHEVEFVVVGGVAVVAHGAGLMTRDLDILYRIEGANVLRLVAALEELDGVAYGDPRRLRFRFDHLNNRGHHLADTKAGRIDALGSVGKLGDVLYETVVVDSVTMEAFGVRFRCISIDRLIALKIELGRPRDLLAVQELQAIKKLRQSES